MLESAVLLLFDLGSPFLIEICEDKAEEVEEIGGVVLLVAEIGREIYALFEMDVLGRGVVVPEETSESL